MDYGVMVGVESMWMDVLNGFGALSIVLVALGFRWVAVESVKLNTYC